MDALEFVKERTRMCMSYAHCVGCPLKEDICNLGNNMSDEEYEKIIAIVEQWSKEHPRKTRQSEFLKQWPEAPLAEDGVLAVCPMSISAAHRNSIGECRNPAKRCRDCHREFWMQEVE